MENSNSKQLASINAELFNPLLDICALAWNMTLIYYFRPSSPQANSASRDQAIHEGVKFIPVWMNMALCSSDLSPPIYKLFMFL